MHETPSRETCLIIRPQGSNDQDADSPYGPANSQQDQPNQEEQALIDRLKQRGLQLQIVNNPPSAMIALACNPAGLLIVIAPPHHSRLDELLEAVARHYPHTTCWAYHLEAEQLQPGQPRLERLGSAQGKQDDAPADDANHQTASTAWASGDQPLVSQQELAMLLGQ